MSPIVSINLCCYNSEKYLKETLQSIIAQTYKDWELIIINDGSTDSTEAIVKEFISQGFPIIYFFQENHGLGYSRNKAIEHSSGEYIAFIDHDDIWMSDKLEKQMSIFNNRSDIDFVYSNYYKMTDYGKKRFVLGLKGKQPEGNVFVDFIYKYLVFIGTVIVTKKSLNSLGTLFDDRFNQIEEYDVFIRLLYKYKAAYLDKPLAIYRYHNTMLSNKAYENSAKEYPILINKLKEMDPIIEKLYPEVIDYFNIQVVRYSQAKMEIINGNPQKARRILNDHMFYSIKLFLMYMASFFPSKISYLLYHKLISYKHLH